MKNVNEYSYIWEEDKEKYVLVSDEYGDGIFEIGGTELMFLLIEDDALAELIVENMIKNGNKVYKNIIELKEDMEKRARS